MAYDLGGVVNGLVGGYFQNKADRQQGKLAMLQGQANLASAVRNRMMTEFDNRLAQRRAEEASADSNVYDPGDPLNVGTQAVKRVTDRGNIALEGAQEQERLASSSVHALKKAIEANRQKYYAQMALHLLGAGIGAYSMWPSQQYTDAERQAAQNISVPGLGRAI